jgi:flagellar biosynthesis anti-sigma factor FlgM
MTNFPLQPVMMVGRAYPNGAKQVEEMAEAKFARRGSEDQVATAIGSKADDEAGADEATLSAAAGFLAVEIDGPAEVRWDRVLFLRSRIAAGTYRVSSVKIAARMIDSMTR